MVKGALRRKRGYLESDDRFGIVELHTLHLAVDVRVAVEGVMLRPLHLLAESDQTDVHISASTSWNVTWWNFTRIVPAT